MTNEVAVPIGQGDQQSHDSNIRDHEPHHPYRVRGIPANAKVIAASKLLKSVLGADNLRMRIRSLALDPHEPQYKVATVTFDQRPESFTPRKSEWRFHLRT